MFVSGIVASASLIGILVAFLVVGSVLAYVDMQCNKSRPS